MISSRRSALAAILLLLFSGFGLQAQHVTTIYYSESWEVCKRPQAAFYRKIELDKAGKPISQVHDYYIDGKLQFCGKLLSMNPDVMDSVCTWYYQDGAIQEQAEYAKGKANGLHRAYYETGQVSSDITYKHGTPASDFKFFYGSGKLESVRHYLAAGDTFPYESYFETGELKEKGLFKRGSSGGQDTLIRSIEYLDTGHVDYNISENPNLRGPGRFQAFRKGRLVSERNFLNGLQDGWDLSYNPNGQLISHTFFRNGKMDSLSEQFIKGQLTRHEEYTNFMPSGTWLDLNKGKVVGKSIYHHDTVECFRYYEDGRIQLHNFSWHSGQIEGREDYYPNGDIQEIKVFSPQVEHLGGVTTDTTFYTRHRVKHISTLFENPRYGKEDPFSDISFDSVGSIIDYKPPVNERIYPVKDNLACVWGFKRYDGTWAIAPKYTSTSASGNYFLVWEGGLCGLISIAGDSVLPCVYTRIEMATFFKTDNSPSILLEKGRLKLPGGYRYDKNDLSKTDFYFVTLDTLHGVLTSHGDTVLPVVYNSVSYNFSDSTITCKKRGTQSIIKLPSNKRVEFAAMIIHPTGINDLYEFTRTDRWPGFGVWYSHPGTGLINSSGRIILADTFNYVNLGLIRKGVIGFGSDGFGLMDTGGRVLLEPKYRLFKPPYQFDPFYQVGLLPLVKGKWVGLFDTNGQQLLPFKYKNITLATYNREVEVTDKKGEIGVYSVSRKKIILACEFDTIMPYSFYQRYYVYVCRKDGLYGLYDDTGKVIGNIWPYYSVLDVPTATFLFSDGRVIVQVSGTGNTSTFYPPTNLPGGVRTGNFVTPTGDNLRCIYNANNNVIYLGKVFDISAMPNGNIFMKDSLGKVIMIDILGNKVADLSAWPHLSAPIARGWFVTWTGTGKYGVINEAGKLIIDTAYTNIWVAPKDDQFTPPVFWVRNMNIPVDTASVMLQDAEETEGDFRPWMGGWRALDYDGNVIIDSPCTLPVKFTNNMVVVETSHGMGAFDDKGKTIFKDTFDAILQLSPDLFLMKRTGLYGIAHKNGDWLTPVKWQKINLVTTEHLVVSQNNALIVLNYNGDTVMPTDYNAFMFSDSNYDDLLGAGISTNAGEDAANYTAVVLGDDDLAQYPLVDKVTGNYFLYKHLEAQGLEANAPGPETITYGDVFGAYQVPPLYETMPATNETSDNVVDFTANTFSTQTINASCYHGGCEYSYDYRNFLVGKHSIVSLTIDSVLNTAGKNATDINELLKEQIAVDEDLHIDCNNAEGFFETYKNNFSIGKTGLTFYLVRDENTFGEPLGDAPKVTVPYGKLGRYLSAGVGKLICGDK